MKRFVLGCLGLFAFVVVAFGALAWMGAVKERERLASVTTSSPQRSMPEQRAIESAEYGRKFLEDDASEINYKSRRNFFDLTLRNKGLRCGEVTDAAMVQPRQWRVTCSAGRAYLFIFDTKGEHIDTRVYGR